MIDYNSFGYLGPDNRHSLNIDRKGYASKKGKKLQTTQMKQNINKKEKEDINFENSSKKMNENKILNNNQLPNNDIKPKENANNNKNKNPDEIKKNINFNNDIKKKKINLYSNVINNNKEESVKDSNLEEPSQNTNLLVRSNSKLSLGNLKADSKGDLNLPILEAISEKAELINISSSSRERREKDSAKLLNYSNKDTALVLNTLSNSKQIVSNRIVKESEINIFKSLIDLSDIIECEPEIESSLNEIENILLRHVTEMKIWYKIYSYRESQKEDLTSVNASIINTQYDDKEKKDLIEKRSSMALNLNGISNNNINNSINTNNNLNSANINNMESIYNNDLGFAMEMKDLWKFLRDSNITCSEFSLAQFNRLFFKGKKNYIEMFLCPDDVDSRQAYKYIYSKVSKSKDEFIMKNRDKLLTNAMVNSININVIENLNLNNYQNSPKNSKNYNYFNNNNYNFTNNTNSTYMSAMITGNPNLPISTSNSISNYNKDSNEDFLQNRGELDLANNKAGENNNNQFNYNLDSNANIPIKNQYVSNFDLHNKKQTVLIRQFFDAIVRAAYLKYYNIDQSLGTKLTILIDNCIKNNLNFKKHSRKANRDHTEVSVNSSVYLDKKYNKVFESNFDFFIFNFERNLKKIFKKYYVKFSPNLRFDDMTITYRFFYENYISKSDLFKDIFTEKIKFVEIINIYHRDKYNINELQKYSQEIYGYIENLFEIEMIFFEFCEVIFFISRKYFAINGINDTKENYNEIIKDLEDNIRTLEISDKKIDSHKNEYYFPKLKYHYDYENLIADRLAKEEDDRRKRQEQRRVEHERKMMEIEDINHLAEFNEEEEIEDDDSMGIY